MGDGVGPPGDSTPKNEIKMQLGFNCCWSDMILLMTVVEPTCRQMIRVHFYKAKCWQGKKNKQKKTTCFGKWPKRRTETNGLHNARTKRQTLHKRDKTPGGITIVQVRQELTRETENATTSPEAFSGIFLNKKKSSVHFLVFFNNCTYQTLKVFLF